ncbi:DUF2254 domain-containing protein [Hydrogenophaga sp.]|uniref:DUF2254 domain-containing protein n=1 Tax=Hydrogenophaga sp. TaxID=1904254 RepID=UPI0025BE2AAD|nr:DUF2254 domain-containing protein [Hydrogenophaga sp.]
MLNRLRAFADSTRSSLWFWPILMTTLGIFLAQALILLDQSAWIQRQQLLSTASDALGVKWLFGLGAEGARSLLTTIAGSMISIAATVFSITIVALSLAAGQLGPRLLRTFMRDRGTQLSLGMFIATFAFCIVVLGVVHSGDAKPFVPSASVTAALVLALGSLAVLIYFIHHVAKSIQAPEVIAVVGADLDSAVEELYPLPHSSSGKAPNLSVSPQMGGEACSIVRSPESGYVQHIDLDALVEFATEADSVVVLARRPGDYVISGTVIATIWSQTKLDAEKGRRVCEAFSFGRVRTPVQDMQNLINQLVEIAQRALSPGINDPSTAEACIDRLASALGNVAGRQLPLGHLDDALGRTRLIVSRPDTFKSLLDAAFDPIRNYSGGSLQACLKMASAIADLAQLAQGQEQRQALLDQAEMIRRLTQTLTEPRDRHQLEAACNTAMFALNAPSRD